MTLSVSNIDNPVYHPLNTQYSILILTLKLTPQPRRGQTSITTCEALSIKQPTTQIL